MSDEKVVRLVCVLKGGEIVASKPATCAVCGRDVVFDPISDANARRELPDHRFEYVCIEHSGLEKRELSAQELNQIRKVLSGTVVGAAALAMDDDELRELLRQDVKSKRQ